MGTYHLIIGAFCVIHYNIVIDKIHFYDKEDLCTYMCKNKER